MQQGFDSNTFVSYETKSVTVNPAMILVNYASLVTINLLSILRNFLTLLCNFLTSNYFATNLKTFCNELTSLLSNMVNNDTANLTNETIYNVTGTNNESNNSYFYLLTNSFINTSSNMNAKKKNNLNLLVVANKLFNNFNAKLSLKFSNFKNYLFKNIENLFNSLLISKEENVFYMKFNTQISEKFKDSCLLNKINNKNIYAFMFYPEKYAHKHKNILIPI